MPDVVDTHVVESGPGADALPCPVDVGHVRAQLSAWNDPRTVGLARQCLQNAAAVGDRWTVRLPDFPSTMRISALLRSSCSQRRGVRISLLRQPVSMRRRIIVSASAEICLRCRRPRPAPVRAGWLPPRGEPETNAILGRAVPTRSRAPCSKRRASTTEPESRSRPRAPVRNSRHPTL